MWVQGLSTTIASRITCITSSELEIRQIRLRLRYGAANV